jgi:hypothetical protein
MGSLTGRRHGHGPAGHQGGGGAARSRGVPLGEARGCGLVRPRPTARRRPWPAPGRAVGTPRPPLAASVRHPTHPLPALADGAAVDRLLPLVALQRQLVARRRAAALLVPGVPHRHHGRLVKLMEVHRPAWGAAWRAHGGARVLGMLRVPCACRRLAGACDGWAAQCFNLWLAARRHAGKQAPCGPPLPARAQRGRTGRAPAAALT